MRVCESKSWLTMSVGTGVGTLQMLMAVDITKKHVSIKTSITLQNAPVHTYINIHAFTRHCYPK